MDKAQSESVLVFGSFALYRSKKILLESGKPVRLGSRALDLLIALVERSGEVVTKNELIALVWPDTFVEEANLRVHVGLLRKILGDGQNGARYIVNVVGRGYSFVAPINRDDSATLSADPLNVRQTVGLPRPSTRTIGRGEDIKSLVGLVPTRRLLSVVGPGGVGKSTVALAVAEELVGSYRDGAAFVDLATISNADLVTAALAAALGLPTASADVAANIISYLKDKRLLIFADNCEHVLDATARLADVLLEAAPGIDILTTSREPFGLKAEHVYRLGSFEVPSHSIQPTASEALAYPAVQLFVSRATTDFNEFQLTDEDAGAVLDICRRLDGVPLAIELVASRVAFFGVRDLLRRLDDKLLFMTRGSRTAQPRHQSLRAALDWSYDLLSDDERRILGRASYFRGPFTLDAAVSVAKDDQFSAEQIVDALINLVSKSLVSADGSGEFVFYKLLHVTRSYAERKLAEENNIDLLAYRHAAYFSEVLRVAYDEWGSLSRTAWIAAYAYIIDDVRACLDWLFSKPKHLALAITFLVRAIPLGFQLSLVSEFSVRVEQALKRLYDLPEAVPEEEIQLNIAFGILTMNAYGAVPEVGQAHARALQLADSIGSANYKVAPLIHGMAYQAELGNYEAALRIAEDLAVVARQTDNSLAILVADRALAQAHHFSGNHIKARAVAERVLNHPAPSIPLLYSPLPVDRKIWMRMILARSLWIQGYADQAELVSRELVDLALTDGPFTACQAIAFAACPIALWNGNYDQARSLINVLLERARRFSLNKWYASGKHFQAALSARLGADLDRAADDADVWRNPLTTRLQIDIQTTILERSFDSKALDGTENITASWCGPELIRIRGKALLLDIEVNRCDESEGLYQRALELSKTQGALAWELRSAISLGQLWQRRKRNAQAFELLSGVCARFSEGHGSRDMQIAQALLDELSA